jgi:phage N-6-adenine-methyltransferase
MDDFTRGKRHSLAAISADIRGQLEAAKLVEERMMALDIKAQKLRCRAAVAFFTHYEDIEAACQRRGITVGNWCKNDIGCGVSHLRKLRQLHQRWDDYVVKRQSYDGDRYGLRLAFTLVGIPTGSEAGTDAHGAGDQHDIDPNDEYTTPPHVFRRFGSACTLDVCATPDKTMCADYYTKEQDALKQPWHGVVWMNPPYRNLIAWCRKAYEYARSDGSVIALLPAWTDAPWFHDYAAAFGRITFLRGKLSFGGRPGYAPFGSIIVEWTPETVKRQRGEPVHVLLELKEPRRL